MIYCEEGVNEVSSISLRVYLTLITMLLMHWKEPLKPHEICFVKVLGERRMSSIRCEPDERVDAFSQDS